MCWHPKVWLNDYIWCGFNENHKSSTFCILGCWGRCQWFKSRTTKGKSSQIRMARRRFRKWSSSYFQITNRSISRNLFATFQMRCLLNIWGVMLFLRLTWVVGQGGLIQGLLCILLCNVVTTITAISMSAVSTNGQIKGGGTYSIWSSLIDFKIMHMTFRYLLYDISIPWTWIRRSYWYHVYCG